MNSMQIALLKGKGYAAPVVEKRGRQFVAITTKGRFRAEALGHDPRAAVENVVKVVVRR